ncbi:hypothetical protein NLJ89_g718 [Agrocybe chaxingu]|uniref:DUF6533 domain-containing protein n=1 Tax=Agrocybe chaxingu TaxID=84603 RepID=A0A9W8N1E2_9AGAR|nr:hypothetical protein NLJ89_g718 [Agrocybe chaxingu]
MSSSKAAMMFIRFCIQYSSVAVLYYDYTLTWTREVQHFWLRKFSLSTALYIACRYGMVANVIYTLALAEKLPTLRVRGYFSLANRALSLMSSCPHVRELTVRFSWANCDHGYQIAAILACIGRTAIVVVWGARTYAVFNRNKWVLAIFTLFGLTVVGLAILHIPYVACNGNRGTPPLSGLMTARFLLHLRDWEYASGPRTETAIVFNHAPVKAAETTTTAMGTRGFMRSMVNEFGEDPVISAQQRATLVATRPENWEEV